jgi:hypothetical protein
MKSLLANWKTTLAGVVAVAIPIINSQIPFMSTDYAAIATGVVAGLGLIFAKDGNVTGGNTKQVL